VRAAEATGPLRDSELDALFASLGDADRVALAVSGGGDSLALLDCIDRWRRSRGGRPEPTVLTVDHRLRRSSAEEAETVAAIARQRRMPARILVWEGPYPTADIEAAARAARYRLLLDATAELGASHLVLAHHRDDQAEGFLMRLQRGAGLFGLAAMRPEIAVGAVTILRPFLELSKARLLATVAAAHLRPLEDAMNSDPRFARSRIRRLMPLLAAEGLDAAAIAATARRLQGAAEALDRSASRVIEEAVATDDLAVAHLDHGRLSVEPEEIRLRVLVRLLLAIGGEAYPPRFERLKALAGAIAAHAGHGRFKRTLAGTVIEWRGGRFAVYREIGRAGLPTMEIQGGFRGLWDHRFEIEIGEGARKAVSLGPLGEEGRLAIGAKAGETAAGALGALPALRRGKTLLAVPSLGFHGRQGRELNVRVRSIVAMRLAEPRLFPDFPAEVSGVPFTLP
jgi:tRNA(Ile)-lysidine synthase